MEEESAPLQSEPEPPVLEIPQLDLCFIMDCTGSMGSYIRSAQDNIQSIIQQIIIGEKSDVRFGLVEYRDHPPQERSYVTRVHHFTSDFEGFIRNKKSKYYSNISSK